MQHYKHIFSTSYHPLDKEGNICRTQVIKRNDYEHMIFRNLRIKFQWKHRQTQLKFNVKEYLLYNVLHVSTQKGQFSSVI